MKQHPGYYPDFRLPAWFNGPASLRALLRELWEKRYEDLYEDEPDDARAALPLPEAIARVLDALDEGDPAVAHQRQLYLALALALAVEPTLASHAPGDMRGQTIIRRLRAALESGRPQPAPDLVAGIPTTPPLPQTLYETLDTFRNAARALDAEQAREALVEALDDVLEGYAVFPGADGRRDLFNWWLTQVVPAAYSRRLPDDVYHLKWPWPPPAQASPPPQ